MNVTISFLIKKGTFSLFHVILITRLRPLKAVHVGTSILLLQSIKRHLR